MRLRSMGRLWATMSWTLAGPVYNHRLRYQTFDVTPLLHEGQNAIGAILGDGWYRGQAGLRRRPAQHLR